MFILIECRWTINGETKLSREKAVKQKAWNKLTRICYEKEIKLFLVSPYNRVKGGIEC